MKNIIHSILKFILLFVPAYLFIGWHVPEMKVQMLAVGLLPTALKALLMGALIGGALIGGTALVDFFKNK